jgi:hypothetical protein
MAKKTWIGVQSAAVPPTGEPDQDRRHRLQQLDDPLDHLVSPAADM